MSNNPFADYQQQFFKMWNENMSKVPGMEAFKDVYEKMMPQAAVDYWKSFASMAPGAEYWNKFAGMMPTPDNMAKFFNPMKNMMPSMENYWKSFAGMMPDSDSFLKMWPVKLPGMESYAKLFDLWKGLSNPAEFAQDFQEKYLDFMEDLLKNFLPEGAVEFFERPKQLMDTCVNFYKETLAPFMQIDESIMERLASGDVTAYTDFFREFSHNYEQSFEKYFNIMGMGLNREANEDMMHAMNAYIKAMIASGSLMSLLYSTAVQSMQTLVETYQNAVTEGKVFTTFRDFYDLWYKVTDGALLDLFNTDEFAKVFGDFSDKYSKYMIAMNREYERMLAVLPIPTNTDMKSLYKTVYDLRKQVRDLNREIEALKATK